MRLALTHFNVVIESQRKLGKNSSYFASTGSGSFLATVTVIGFFPKSTAQMISSPNYILTLQQLLGTIVLDDIPFVSAFPILLLNFIIIFSHIVFLIFNSLSYTINSYIVFTIINTTVKYIYPSHYKTNYSLKYILNCRVI